MITEADWGHWSADELKPYVLDVLDIFGPERCMFGTDWPVCLVAGSYAQVIGALRSCLADLGEAQREQIFRPFGDRSVSLAGVQEMTESRGGTALLVFCGLSIVTALWGTGAPLLGLPISPAERRMLSGFLFRFGWRLDRLLPDRTDQRRAHQPGDDTRLLARGQDQVARRRMVQHLAASWRESRRGLAARLGASRSQHPLGRLASGTSAFDLGRSRGRDALHLPARPADLHVCVAAVHTALHALSQSRSRCDSGPA